MAGQDLSHLIATGLLRDVEAIVVEGHRMLYETQRRAWSRPVAYKWLRYEDPVPVRRLSEGVNRLREAGVKFDAGAVDKACAKASEMGFLN